MLFKGKEEISGNWIEIYFNIIINEHFSLYLLVYFNQGNSRTSIFNVFSNENTRTIHKRREN